MRHQYSGYERDALARLGLFSPLATLGPQTIDRLGLNLFTLRDATNQSHVDEDRDLLARGVLDPLSYRFSYLPHHHHSHTIEITVTRPDGTLRCLARSHNLRTNAGGDFFAQQFAGAASTAVANWLALSNDAVAPAPTDTTLAGEITSNGFGRVLATLSHTPIAGGTNATVGGTLSLTGNWTATAAQDAQKCAVFTASTGGTMVLEAAFSQFIAELGDAVQLVYGVGY